MAVKKHERVAPRAAVLIESMRDIGYSLQTALADIIDNSITAGASSIQLLADTTASAPCFAILDDGEGMSDKQLLEAMRPGTRSPLEERSSKDLGRFGLGLKTASFSQCRRLTVVSRANGNAFGARWDLDEVAKSDDWLVEVFDDPHDIPWIDQLGERGTLVVWEKLDRLTDRDGAGRSSLIDHIDQAADHIELVFHRFLSGEKGLSKVSISLNARRLQPFDPFHSTHPATQAGPIETIRIDGHNMTIQAFTLPHHKKVSADEWNRYGRKEGYLKNQGFYVYRGKRLIIHGTWFGLARQAELTKLARVRIDMPNGLDSDWKIDVKKASAHPPAKVRERLRRIIETIGATSKRVYTERGRKLVSESRIPVWVRVQEKNEIIYRLNSEHPVLTEFESNLTDELKRDFRRILELTGASMPIDSLFADIGSTPDQVGSGSMSDDGLIGVLETTWRSLRSGGFAPSDIKDMLQVTEPFRSTWERASWKIEELMREI
jgi:hypothetical protein